MKEQNGFAEVNGTRLYYECAGSGHRMVLIHGFTLDTRLWDDQFETLAQHYQVIRYDLRGFGKSALPTGESYSHADDLKALIENLEIEHASIVGLSLGGMIAIDFAHAYPGATDALIPVDSALSGYQWKEFGPALMSIGAMARESGVQAAKELWLGHDLFKPAREKPDVVTRLAQMVSDYSGWHFVNENPVREPDTPTAQRLAEIIVPTLIIVGERDLPDFQAIADTLQQHIHNAQKVVIPGVGHLSNMEDAERFNEILLNFLADL